ncbi:MAG: hypothetical protein AB7K86_03160 [Rhodospirillales bacterium]
MNLILPMPQFPYAIDTNEQGEKSEMAGFTEMKQRWDDYRASKAAVFWTGAACVVATLIVGFTIGGWVTGGTARDMAETAADDARAELAAAVCVDEFMGRPDARAQLASLRESSYWERDTIIEKGGFATPPGIEEPISGAASLCVSRLLEAQAPAEAKTEAAGSSG